MIMRFMASTRDRNRRSVGIHGRRAAAPVRAAPRLRGRCSRPARRRRASSPRPSIRAWPRPIRTSSSRSTSPTRATGSTSCSSRCPMGPRRSCPSCASRSASRRLVGGLPADTTPPVSAVVPRAAPLPELLSRVRCTALPELYRDAIIGAQRCRGAGLLPDGGVARAGAARRDRRRRAERDHRRCRHRRVRRGVGLKENTAFCTVDEDFIAYGLLDHRHTPEIEQETGAQVLFTPHLAPMSRGILATCYARPTGGSHRRPSRCSRLSGRAYGSEPFVVVRPARRRPRRRSAATCATSRRASTHARTRSSRSARSTTSPRARREARCSAPTWHSAPRDDRPADGGDVPVTGRHAAEKAATLVEALPVHPPLRRAGSSS